MLQDIFYQFGDELSEGIVGNFDPPPHGAAIGRPRPQPSTRLDDAGKIGPAATPIFVFDKTDEASLTGTIDAPRDKDVFQFTPSETGKIAIDATTPQSNLDTNLTVLSATGRRLISNENFGGSTDSHVELNVVAGQTYYIQLAGSRRTTGEYELAVDYLLGGAAADDHGNTNQTATVLALGTNGAHATGGIGLPGDVDVFKFTATTSGRLAINVGTNGRLDSVLAVYDSRGRLIDANDNATTASTTDSRVTINVAAGQTYFIRVRGQAGKRGDYELALDWLLDGAL